MCGRQLVARRKVRRIESAWRLSDGRPTVARRRTKLTKASREEWLQRAWIKPQIQKRFVYLWTGRESCAELWSGALFH